MSVFYRRISGAPSVIFPIRNSDFQSVFKDSLCAQGVCFAFSILFLKNEHLDMSDARCREGLIVLQRGHEAAIENHKKLLTEGDLISYGLRFVAKSTFETLDIPAITQGLNEWVLSNNESRTRVLLSMSIQDADGDVRKHFSPLMFDPHKNQWEVGDTTFALDKENTVVRGVMPATSLDLYLSWQIQYVVGYSEENLKLTLFHVKLRK